MISAVASQQKVSGSNSSLDVSVRSLRVLPLPELVSHSPKNIRVRLICNSKLATDVRQIKCLKCVD